MNALLGYGRSNDVDRSSNEFVFSNERAFGTWTSVHYSHSANSDGSSDTASVVRPFYALDARWAAGVVASRYDRIDAVYNAGEVASEYRHRQRGTERQPHAGRFSPSGNKQPAHYRA